MGEYSEAIYTEQEGISTLWTLVSVGFVYFMQFGFCILEMGCIRWKNTKSVMVKMVIETCLSGIIFWFVGFGFGYGINHDHSHRAFIGGDEKFFGLSGAEETTKDMYPNFLFFMVLANIPSKIASGSVTERITLGSCLTFSVLWTGFVYATVDAWTFAEGWLFERGFRDFAGSGVLHMMGAITGAWGAYFLGPRLGKYKYNKPEFGKLDLNDSHVKEVLKNFDEEFKQDYKRYIQETFNHIGPHSEAMITFATLILIPCWFYFNGGTQLNFAVAPRKNNAAKIITNTVIGGWFGGATTALLRPKILGSQPTNRVDIGGLCNGLLAGLVAVTGNSDAIEPWAAMIIGSLGAIMYMVGCHFIEKFELDDPCEACCVHGWGGFTGVIMTGFFHNEFGVFYKKGNFLGYQIAGLIVIILWTSFFSILFFFFANKFGKLRIPMQNELMGNDVSEFGGLTQETIYKVLEHCRGRNVYKTQDNIVKIDIEMKQDESQRFIRQSIGEDNVINKIN